jgi:hypothetical protein
MRGRHAILLVGTLIVVGALLGFAVHQTRTASQRAAEASAQSRAATAVMIADAKLRRKYEVKARPWRVAPQIQAPRGMRVKPHTLSLGRPATRPTPQVDSAPAMPGPGPTLNIPAPPDIALPDVPDPGPDPCETDPPDSLDECADMPTVGSMNACIQYRVDCYGPWG